MDEFVVLFSMGFAATRCPLGYGSFRHDDSRHKSYKLDHQLENENATISYPISVPSYPLKVSRRRIASLPDIGDFFWQKDPTPLLDVVDLPIHLKNLSLEELKQLAKELRSELSFILSKTPISYRASLAVVELTIAIHYVYHAPMDKVLWDAGDQTYAHKILTGRRSQFHTLRQKNGISGYTSRAESEYDAFGASHGCNSLSAGLGMAVARDLTGKKDRIVTVISNWSTMAGQIYEAMGNAGDLDCNLVVILNDSRHSLHPKPEEGQKMTINAISSTLSKFQSSTSFRKIRAAAKGVTKKIGMGMHEFAAKIDQYARGMIGPLGSTLFEELGLYYIGPVDGHNLDDLITVLSEVVSFDATGPVLIHVITGDQMPSTDAVKTFTCHEQGGVSESGPVPSYTKFQGMNNARTLSDCLVEGLIAEAEKDKKVVAVHAGMGMDTRLLHFHSKFPDRFFDVGMAEQHAVTFAAGLSFGGLKPFCIIPSTFLQRAYDQIIQDVDLQKAPVRFVITSAGLVGSDGPSQCGAFDITYMACLPSMIVMAPSNEDDLADMVTTAASVDDRPICFRYPRGTYTHIGSTRPGRLLEIGKGEIMIQGKHVALLGYGLMVQNCIKAQSILAIHGIQATVANAKFCKPLDIDLIRKLCREHDYLITVEEGTVGGFSSHVAQFIALDGLLDGRIKWRPIVLPDNYIEQATPREQIDMAGLSGHHIAASVLSLLGRNREALFLMR